MGYKYAFKVVGVTFDNRQEIIAKLTGNEPVRLIPEPFNKFDKNAIGVNVAFDGEIIQIGYMPKDRAATFAPYVDGEELTGEIVQISGGFIKPSGDVASYGIIVVFELPDDAGADMAAGWSL